MRFTSCSVCAVTVPVPGSIVSVILPRFAPYEPVCTTGRVRSVPGIGADQAYSLCVWPVKIAATFGSVSFTSEAKAPPAASS